MTIAIAGTGYVGLSNAILLAQKNKVYAVDVIQGKVDLINQKKSPIVDKEIQEYLSEKELDLTATTDSQMAYKNADFIIISTPTNYDSEKNFFDTSSIEAVLKIVKSVNPDAIVVIKSTIPVGYTEKIRKEMDMKNILFSHRKVLFQVNDGQQYLGVFHYDVPPFPHKNNGQTVPCQPLASSVAPQYIFPCNRDSAVQNDTHWEYQKGKARCLEYFATAPLRFSRLARTPTAPPYMDDCTDNFQKGRGQVRVQPLDRNR